MKGFLQQRAAVRRCRMSGEGEGHPQGHGENRVRRGQAPRSGQFRGNDMRGGRYGGALIGGQLSDRDRQ